MQIKIIIYNYFIHKVYDLVGQPSYRLHMLLSSYSICRSSQSYFVQLVLTEASVPERVKIGHNKHRGWEVREVFVKNYRRSSALPFFLVVQILIPTP